MRTQLQKLLVIFKSCEAWVIVVCLVFASSCFASTSQHETFTNAVPFSSSLLGTVPGLNQEKATLDNPAAAMALINAMTKVAVNVDQSNLPVLNGKQPNTYVLIHLLSWNSGAKAKVAANHWYLYRDVAAGKWSQEDFTTANRLLGVKKLNVLLLQFNAAALIPGGVLSYTPDYDFTITRKTPANVAHLYALLQAFTGGTATVSENTKAAGDRTVGRTPTLDAVWEGGILNLQYVPSDILIKSTFHVIADDSDQKLADDITFDNEGPYYWDVGFAVPVRKISELKLDTTSGTATPANVGSESVFAVLDGYLRPVDVKGSGFTAIPHPIAGIAFAKRPLSKILIGGAWGPKASELYMGAMFVNQPELSGSTSCSSPSGTSLTGKLHYCSQFTFGINLSVSAIASKLGAPK